MKTVLLLSGESSDLLAVNVCQALGRRGMTVAAAGLTESGRMLRLSRYFTTYAGVASTREEMEAPGGAVLDRVERAARACGAEYVFGVNVAGSLCASRLKERLPRLKYFPAPDPETVRLMDNKWTFHQLLVKHGLPAPKTWLVESLDAARRLPLPLVLKPLALSASLGVHAVTTVAEIDFLLGGGDKHLRLPALAQEFVSGKDGSLSFLAENGRLNAWTVHVRWGDGGMDYIDDARVVDLGRRLAKAVSYTGFANIGLRYDGPERSSVTFIECNPRVWSSMPLTEGLGVDFIGRALELAAGRVPAAQAGAPTGACANLRGILRRLAAGRRLSPCEAACLSGAANDPFPVVGRGVLGLIGRGRAS